MTVLVCLLLLATSAIPSLASRNGAGCRAPPPPHSYPHSSPTPYPTATPPPPPTSADTHCPTVTSTETVCSTCRQLECLAVSTISNPCDCSETVPTVYAGYPCELSTCPPGCASTSYVYAMSTSTCPPKSTELPESCTTRPIQTLYSRSGCALPCTTDQFCIADALVTLPCGCPSVVVRPTTTTICPLKTPCLECTTGWGIGTVTASCPTNYPV